MFRKYVSLALVGLLLNLTFYSTAMANTEKDAKFAEKVKASIAKLGTGRDTKVEIKLKDGTNLTATPFSFAQTLQNDWSAVQKLVIGTDLFIKTSNGKTVNGSLVTFTDNEVELSIKGSRLSLLKNNVEAIYFALPKSKKLGKIIGAVVGFLAGGVVADEDNYSALVVFPIAGAIGGAFIGSLFGKGKKKGALIYKAK